MVTDLFGAPRKMNLTEPVNALLFDLGGGKNRLGGSCLAQCFQLQGGETPDLDDPQRLRRFGPRDDAQALLAPWLGAYWQGLHQPLPLFPKSSLAYADKLAKGKPPEQARKAAEEVWVGGYNRTGEGTNAYYRLAFPQGVSFEGQFEHLSQVLLLPMLQALGEEG